MHHKFSSINEGVCEPSADSPMICEGSVAGSLTIHKGVGSLKTGDDTDSAAILRFLTT